MEFIRNLFDLITCDSIDLKGQKNSKNSMTTNLNWICLIQLQLRVESNFQKMDLLEILSFRKLKI